MKRRLVLGFAAVFGSAALAAGIWFYLHDDPGRPRGAHTSEAIRLVRPHAPVLGAVNGRVTIVEFFDPACEACRAFHPYVKQILAAYQPNVRLVLRYVSFHHGSEEAVHILEAARVQDCFEAVLQALLDRQPEWADHGKPNLEKAWSIAADAGLDAARARKEEVVRAADAVVKQDSDDLNALGVHKTPTFYVNGTLLSTISPQGLADLTLSELTRGSAVK